MDFSENKPSVSVIRNGNKIITEIDGNKSERYSVFNFRADQNQNGKLKRLSIDIKNKYNNTTETIISTNINTFRKKLNKKVEKWEKEYTKAEGKKEAKIRTEKAKDKINYLKNILKFTLKSDKIFDINKLKKKDEKFNE